MKTGRKRLFPYSRALGAGVSVTALLASGVFAPAMAGNNVAQLLSPGNLAQIAGQRASATQAAAQAASLGNPQIQAQIALSQANLAKAAQALANLNAAQKAATAASKLTLDNAPLSGSAWNGSALSGLKPADDTNPTLWINADPLQKDPTTKTATVKQTSPKALLTWQSFDLNKGETLVFNQQGNADWTVLNRIVAGPANASGARFIASPSMILGSIKADGAVYVINPNGVIFGPTAQINVHSLIATSLDVGNPSMTLAQRNSFYLNNGILITPGTNSSFDRSFSYNQSDTALQGDVKVEAGATITTNLAPRSISPDTGGFVYLIAPNVENDGTITTPVGETMMLAAQQVQLNPNIYAAGGEVDPNSPTAKISTFRAVGANFNLNSSNVSAVTPWRADGAASGQITKPGAVINTGLISAERGVVILNGDLVTNGALTNAAGRVTQSGVIQADTSITRNSQIFLDARLKLSLTGGSSILVQPDENGETIPLSSSSIFVPGSVEMQGNTVDVESGSLILDPGGNVAITGVTNTQVSNVTYPDAVMKAVAAQTLDQARIYLAADSTIDVSGLDNVVLPMSYNLVTFKPFGNEFADQPLQRNGALKGVQLTVDVRQTGILNGVAWVGTPLANVVKLAGSQLTASIDQLLTTGGKVALSSQAADQIIMRQGATINLAGGYVRYEGGVVNTSNLLTADGRVVNIANANPLETYVGVAGVSTLAHPHWGPSTSQTFVDPLLSGGQYQPGYIEGHDAGGITFNAGNLTSTYALDGTFYAGAIVGERQAALGIRPTSSTANSLLANPNAMPSSGYFSIFGGNDLVLENTVAALPAKFALNTALPADRTLATELSTDVLTQAGFGQVTAKFSGQLQVAADANLTVATGGSISLTAGSADIEGDLTARSGSISVQTNSTVAVGDTFTITNPVPPDAFNLTIGAHAALNTSGLWVNDIGANPQTLVGGAYVNGGSINLSTATASATCTTLACTSLAGLGTAASVDITGNIVLQAGSLLNVSSGGRIGTNGQFQTDSRGRAVGNGGNVSLQTYVGGFNVNDLTKIPTTTLPTASIVLSGSDGSEAGNAQALNSAIKGYGFAQGGKLVVQAPGFQIGGAPSTAAGTISLPASFFDGNGFGEYDLTSVTNGTTVAANTIVTLRQRNLIADPSLIGLATGSDVTGATGVGYLPGFIRSPVNLTLNANLAPLPSAPYDPPATLAALNPQVALLIDSGAVIAGDPLANINIMVAGRVLEDPAAGNSQVGNVATQVGVAEILGTVRAPGGAITVTGGTESEIWLGAHSILDAAGIAATDTRQLAYHAGKVLAGGSVSIGTTDVTGSLVALTGSKIDVSGASGTFDILHDATNGLPGVQYLPTSVWSDAGTISLSASTLLYDGSFQAKAGAALGNGGTLIVSAPTNDSTITVRQTGSAIPADLTPTDPLTAVDRTILFDAARLAGSGIANLTLSAGPTTGQVSPGTVQFGNKVKIGGLDRLVIDASVISLPNLPKGWNTNDCSVCLSADYFEWQGSGNPANAVGTGVLTVDAGAIDIAAGGLNTNTLSLSGVAQANFISTGDIRLLTPLANAPLDLAPGASLFGELLTSGNLTLQAAQIYPASAVDFTLKSSGAAGQIAFLGNGQAATRPLSAGGRLTVDAATIVQGGTILAPLGTIQLGAATAADLSRSDTTSIFVATRNVTLEKGSVTSVSLAGLIVPYGQTADGKNWSYDSQSGLPLTEAPAKDINISGAHVNLLTGATVDLSGGGDLQAMEFVNGTGGTRDVLVGANVYAIIPGYNPGAAPFDYGFAKIQGDSQPLAGSAVYLTASSGLPAGYYTLLPAHYATLPGAYRIQVVSGSQDALASQNTVLADGTLQVAGYFAQTPSGTRSARTTLFDVQSSAVWRQYSEIDQTSANTYFAALANSSPGSSARLPIDAGHLVVDALKTANLSAALVATTATGGRGSEVDIAGPDLQILAPSGTAAAGYVGLNANELTGLGADSLLIGGVRTDSATGVETITPTANSVEISNDASAPLVAPEIILVTGTQKSTSDPNAANGLVLDSGSVIKATGTLAANDPTTFSLADTRQQVAGDGAILAVSTGTPLTLQRANTTGTTGNISIDSNVTLGGGSLTIDARGAIAIATGSTYALQNIAITSAAINFGSPNRSAGGAVLNAGVVSELSRAKTLTLRSLGAMNFDGSVRIDLTAADSTLTLDSADLTSSGKGKVTLTANTVALLNSGAASAETAVSGQGLLQINAVDAVLGEGSKLLRGFSSVDIKGTRQVTLSGSGSLDAGAAALTIDTSRILVASGAVQTVTTTGSAVLTGTPDTVPAAGTAQIGGAFTLNAGAISDATLIQATAGGVTFEATTGDVTLASGAQIKATGFAQTFFDVTRVASGGAVNLISDKGSIIAASGSRIDVSSAAGQTGSAGSVSLLAANGDVGSAKATAFDMAVIAGDAAGDGGGRLAIDARSIGTTSLVVPSLFSNTVDVHVHQGDLTLGAALTAQNVSLTADAGTLTVGQTIDASGAKGGTVSLFGGRGVVLTTGGKILATATDATKRGGDVVIGTEVASANGSANDGIIDLQGGAIDVSNSANAAMGGTVRLRAPLTAAGNDVAINPVAANITGASSVTIEAFKVFDTSNSAFNGVIDPAGQGSFYGSCTATGACTGTLTDFVEKFALTSTALAKFSGVSAGALHVQPGIDLVNNDPTVNGGNITVASAWNLGAGIAGNLVNLAAFTDKNGNTVAAGTVVTDQNGQLLAQYANYKGQLFYESGTSDISKLFYRVGESTTGEAGTLTLRAAGNVDINASISDGFFQTQNRLDPTYLSNLNSWIATAASPGATTNVSNVGGYIIAGSTALNPVDPTGASLGLGAPPSAPYVAGVNAISPVSTPNELAPIAESDLFPLIKGSSGPIVGTDGNYRAVQSWSYRIVGGADVKSANPLAVLALANFADSSSASTAGQGNVTIAGGGAIRVRNVNSGGGNTTLEIPTIVRTGTGSIDIAAGRDFVLANTEAPGVVYTAGRSSVALPDPVYKMETVNDPLNPGQTITIPVATNPGGFQAPDLLTCDPSLNCNPYGVVTSAAYPVDGGRLTVTAQQDILGYQNASVLGKSNAPNWQFFSPWLLAQGTTLSDTEYGAFSTLSGYVATGGNIFTPSQTSWWINFGSFDQGLMSAGGDVQVVAGRDISQLGVSLPTTARVSGGLSSTIVDSSGNVVANVPVVHLNASGDLTVIAGRNIESGSFYEGSGAASIKAGGSVAAGWSAYANATDHTSPLIPVSTVLAVDTGQITLSARGSVDIAGVVSAASLQNVADLSGAANPLITSSFISSYGAQSAVTVQSVSGDAVMNSLANAPTASASNILIENPLVAAGGGVDDSAFRGVSAYPASFEAASLAGDIKIEGAFQLAASDTGTLNLLAYGSLITQSSFNYQNTSIPVANGFQAISTGPTLVEKVFSASDPLAGFGPDASSSVLDLGARLLHQNDAVPDLFYAVSGDIISGQGQSTVPAGGTAEYALSWEINKTAQVHAGRDIVDLPFFGQNLAATDVTQIVAGRDLYYTGALPLTLQSFASRPDLSQPENGAGLSLAGPGFFDIEAGRNLGPFVTSVADAAAAQNTFAVSDPTGTGIVTFGNNVTVGNRLMIDGHDVNQNKLDNPFAIATNFLLPRQGADIVTMFGVAKGVDYQAVIKGYIDPTTAKSAHNYGPDLVAFLQTLGMPAQTQATAWTTFNALPSKLQNVFVDKVYFNELKLAAVNKDFSIGYNVVGTLFPTAYGYTDNGVNGAGLVSGVVTGNLDMLHATIKTLQAGLVSVANTDGTQSSIAVGGDVTIMGPGGNVTVGSQAVELNSHLTASALGILTLDNGVIDSFTDGSLLVNESRILTVQGGDIVLWSSNGDLDAGRGAKTTVDFKPLSVNFDPSDLQTINLNGLVSGAGIGTIQSTPDAPAASATLIAPRGTVNAGDAGLRTSGNLSIVALRVLNAANISAIGAVSGVPSVSSVNLGSLESASSTAGAGAQAAQDAVAAAANRNAQVGVRHLPDLITVEVLGFGDCDPDAGKKCQE